MYKLSFNIPYKHPCILVCLEQKIALFSQLFVKTLIQGYMYMSTLKTVNVYYQTSTCIFTIYKLAWANAILDTLFISPFHHFLTSLSFSAFHAIALCSTHRVLYSILSSPATHFPKTFITIAFLPSSWLHWPPNISVYFIVFTSYINAYFILHNFT
jgi:hypothetical protein